MKVLDGTGKQIHEYRYGPYGNLEYSKGTSDNRFIFTGKEWDSESGLFYFGARYYDPTIGRWISKDPMDQFFSEYSYCGNDPLHMVDPWGLLASVDGELVIEVFAYAGMEWTDVTQIVEPPSWGDNAFDFLHATFDFGMDILMSPKAFASYMTYEYPKPWSDQYNDLNNAFWESSSNWRDFKYQSLYNQVQMVEGAGLAVAASYGAFKGSFAPVGPKILFEAEIKGTSRASHRYNANKEFYKATNNESYKAHMKTGKGALKNPPDMIWHHPIDNKYILQLMSIVDHTNPLYQALLHPLENGGGGFNQFKNKF